MEKNQTGGKLCAYDVQKWTNAFPGLSQDYFGNIEKYCNETNKNETQIKKEVLALAVELAQKIYSTGEENWLKKMEVGNELTFIKSFEDGYKPVERRVLPSDAGDQLSQTPIADLVEDVIVARKSIWGLTGDQYKLYSVLFLSHASY